MLKSNTERPAWVSDSERGMFHSYKHRHRRPREGDDCIMRDYYNKSMGFATRSQCADLMEN